MMTYTIAISKVTDGEQEFIIGCEFKNKLRADQVYSEIDNKYQTEPDYFTDYLIDLYHGDDLVSTFVTNAYNADMIYTLYFNP